MEAENGLTVGQRVTLLKKFNRLSRIKLAARLGTTQMNVYLVEKDRRPRLNVFFLQRFAKEFGVTTSQLLGEEPLPEDVLEWQSKELVS